MSLIDLTSKCMKNSLSFFVFAALLLLGCRHQSDEKRAVEIVERELSVSGNLSAHRLGGGFGSATVFLVTNDSQKYVVKFFGAKKGGSEIYNSKIASDGGYGPKVYCADPSRGILISEYLSGKKISFYDLELDQFYVALAHLLQKIHRGKEFMFPFSRYDAFARIERDVKNCASKCDDSVPLADVERIVTTIRAALLPHQTTTPCHNDLHGGNLIFFGNEFKAIDYGDAGPGDPYFDMATVSVYSLANQAHEKILLTTYLEHEPTAVERAKLYLMKQVVMIKWAFDRLRALSPEDLLRYNLVQAPSTNDWFRKSLDGKVDVANTEDCLITLKVLLNQVFENAKSQEYKDAVAILG